MGVCLCDTGDPVCALGKCSTTEPLLQLVPFFQGISGPLSEEVEAQKGQRVLPEVAFANGKTWMVRPHGFFANLNVCPCCPVVKLQYTCMRMQTDVYTFGDKCILRHTHRERQTHTQRPTYLLYRYYNKVV